jgi:FAD/FMN-containing dehydrogenase
MVTLTAAHRSAIERIVTPERARFDLGNRRAVSRDDGIQPPRLWALGRRTVADGVVWPEHEQEIIDLTRLARAEGIALVARGGGTAAAGGAVPTDGGLVVDLSRLSGTGEVHDQGAACAPGEYLVDVCAGTLWSSVAFALGRVGLAPRLYPSSAQGSTVGGWLAQGGAGIGSFAFGWFDQNVVSARLVDSTGRVYQLSGLELDGVSEAEGTTGIITEVRLHARPESAIQPTAIAFADAASLVQAVQLATARELPLWSITFVDPSGATCIDEARYASQPLACPAAERLPHDAYVALFAYPVADREIAAHGLQEIARAVGGRWLSAQLARAEWAARFQPLRLLRRGHATAPADIVVPNTALVSVLDALRRGVPQGVSVEGTFVRGGEVVVHAYVDPDVPGASAGLGVGFALRAMDIAARHGGRGQSTGRYFGRRAKSILGAQRIELMREMRVWLDPAGIFNPGKVVFDNSALGLLVQLAARVPHIPPTRQSPPA